MYVIAKIRLAKDPRAIQTKTGTRMESGFGFADIGGDDGLPVAMVAFGSLADELAKYQKGATLRVSGTFSANDYTNRDGEEVHGHQITIEGLAGVKSAGGVQHHQGRQPAQKQTSKPDFDDDPAF